MIFHIIIILVVFTTFIIGVISIETSIIIQAFPQKYIDKETLSSILRKSSLSFIHLDYEGFNNNKIRVYFSESFIPKGIFLILIPYIITFIIIISTDNIYYRLIYMLLFISANYALYKTIKIYFFIQNTYS